MTTPARDSIPSAKASSNTTCLKNSDKVPASIGTMYDFIDFEGAASYFLFDFQHPDRFFRLFVQRMRLVFHLAEIDSFEIDPAQRTVPCRPIIDNPFRQVGGRDPLRSAGKIGRDLANLVFDANRDVESIWKHCTTVSRPVAYCETAVW